MEDNETKTPPSNEPQTPATESKPVSREALTGSGEFSERGINVVALVQPTGAVPEPGGLPAATGRPTAEAPSKPAPTPSEPPRSAE